ncbi:hypothetical protein GCM10027589_13620 [Actinocorallia lasiicapitis]
MTAFRVYLRVVSGSMRPEEITRSLGVEPDEEAALGTLRRPGGAPRGHTTWIRKAGAARPEECESRILAWGEHFAQSLRRLVGETDATVTLEIVQEIRDLEDSRQKGIFLSSALIEWLGIARASIDIDQYIYHDCPEYD